MPTKAFMSLRTRYLAPSGEAVACWAAQAGRMPASDPTDAD